MLPLMWLAATLIATAISWAVVQAVSTAVVDQQPPPLSHSAVSRDLSSPASLSTITPAPTPSAAAQPASAGPTAPPASTAAGGTATQPTTRSSPPPAAPASPPPTSSTRTFSMVGGTAQLTCTNNQISLDYATPNAGFWVETGSSDGGSTIDIKFRSDSHESELQSWCSGGQVQGTVQEQSS